MTRALLGFGMAACAALLIAGGMVQGAQGVAADEAAVREVLRQWDEAFLRRDMDTLARVLAEDFTLTNAAGQIVDRKQYLMSIVKAPDMQQATGGSEDVQVRVLGETVAVVTGRSPVKGRPGGRALVVHGQYRFTDVYVKRDGRWQAVVSHSTSRS